MHIVQGNGECIGHVLHRITGSWNLMNVNDKIRALDESNYPQSL